MQCDNCGVNEATSEVTRISNGQRYTQHLCPTCAADISSSGGASSDVAQERTDITGYFSERLKQSIQEAALEAISHKNRAIDTQHLLLGILKEDVVVDKILKKLDLKKDDLVSYVRSQMTDGQENVETPGLAPRAKNVLQLSFQEKHPQTHL